MEFKSMAVFCGSRTGSDSIYMKMAGYLGKKLAQEKKTLIYGGSHVGCMGAMSDACLEAGGQVIGVIPEKLKNVEVAHQQLTELHVVKTMHERKAKMADLADVFVALPGGAGTLEEWFEVFTWSQIGYHQKPCCLLNINGFFDPLIAMLDHTIDKGFMDPSQRDFIMIETSVEGLLEALQNKKV
ncbi:TIGR00730 family Rossman fold protein [Salipaludibacillus sp. HK11]|uniref:LOG family protein n=1 Tax=Salipaludibacillus sp. HK11 TaxID=3394320 RepID=UPI0039FDACE9